jgi:hypothetical protein
MKKLIAPIAAIVALAMFAATAFAATTVVKVSGNTTVVENTPGGWYFNRDLTNATPYEFNNDKASIGTGSLYVKPIDNIGVHKFIAEHYLLTQLSNVSSISYDFEIGAGGTAASFNQFYMNVYMNYGTSSPTNYYDCRYDVLATSGSTSAFTTVTFLPGGTYPVVTRGAVPPCPTTPAAMGAGATIRAIAITVGDTSASDAGLDAYLDKVAVALTNGNTTIYNFDPALPTPADKDACKNDGWKTLFRADGSSFKNQGDCVSYTNNGR